MDGGFSWAQNHLACPLPAGDGGTLRHSTAAQRSKREKEFVDLDDVQGRRGRQKWVSLLFSSFSSRILLVFVSFAFLFHRFVPCFCPLQRNGQSRKEHKQTRNEPKNQKEYQSRKRNGRVAVKKDITRTHGGKNRIASFEYERNNGKNQPRFLVRPRPPHWTSVGEQGNRTGRGQRDQNGTGPPNDGVRGG